MGKYMKIKNMVRLLALCMTCTIFNFAVLVHAQQVPVILNNPEVLHATVAPGQTSATIPLQVYSTSNLKLQVIVPVAGASFVLVDPLGNTIISSADASVTAVNGSNFNPPLPGGSFILPDMVVPIDGQWELIFSFPEATEQTVILTTVYAQSNIQVGLLTDRSEYRLGQVATLALPALDSGQPIIGLSPTISVTLPNGDTLDLIAEDNGDIAQYDGMASDGVYSAGIILDHVGQYRIKALIEINNPGQSLVREVNTAFNVTEALVSLDSITGNIVEGGDDCVAGVEVAIQGSVFQPGTYVGSARLEALNGQVLEASKSLDLSQVGPLQLDLGFSAEEIRTALNSDGPYFLKNVDILSFMESGIALEARQVDVTQIQNVNLDNLCVPPIFIANDMNVEEELNDGFIGRLRFNFPVTVSQSGSYQISFKITDNSGEDLSIQGINQVFSVGTNIVSTTLDAQMLQSSDGPYTLESVLILGRGSSAQKSIVGRSKPYSRWQFFPTLSGDLDADGDVDASDRAILLGARGEMSLFPGDRRDLTRDGKIDLRDARMIVSLRCENNSCP